MKPPAAPLAKHWLIRSAVPFVALVALSTAMGCDDAETADTPSVDGCSDLRALLASGPASPGARYTGANGFAFESAAGVVLDAGDADTCERLERSAEALLASGAPGASLTYRTPRFRVQLARGLADVEAGVPLRTDALVRVASVAKTYVGALAALLASEGRIDLDNTDGDHALSDYLPETHGRIEYADRITLRQLLNHTSGVPDYYGERVGPAWITHLLDSYHRGVGVTEDEALSLVYGVPPDFEPGTSGTYSNTAFLLAARVLDRVLGHSYIDELRTRFLDPLGLDDTYFEKHDSVDASRLSHGYRDASELGESFSDWYGVDQGYGFANGGIVARLDQIEDFFRAVPGGQALPPGIDTRQFLEALRPADINGYGLGLDSNQSCYFHSGTFAGYVALGFYCTDRDISGVLFVNSSLPEHDTALYALGLELMNQPAAAVE